MNIENVSEMQYEISNSADVMCDFILKIDKYTHQHKEGTCIFTTLDSVCQCRGRTYLPHHLYHHPQEGLISHHRLFIVVFHQHDMATLTMKCATAVYGRYLLPEQSMALYSTMRLKIHDKTRTVNHVMNCLKIQRMNFEFKF